MTARFPVTLTTALLALAVGLASCQQTEEDTSQVATEGPAASAAPTSAPPATPSPTTAATFGVTPTPMAPPDDWAAYSDPDGRFTIRYPSGWLLQDGANSAVRPPDQLTVIFYSYDPAESGKDFPPDGFKVDLYVYPLAQNDCTVAPSDASAATLGGVQGWQRAIAAEDEKDVRSVGVVVHNAGFCYSLHAFFGKEITSDDVFQAMVDGFAFTSQSG